MTKAPTAAGPAYDLAELVFENSYADQLPGTYAPIEPPGFPDPELVALNGDVARDLGWEPERLRPVLAAVVAGNKIPDTARPIALAYAGHQFGHFSPLLGDGRALLLGERIDRRGLRQDLHLKGSGPTPFSRGGDGYAALGPVLREYLISEAMHHLGVPTTRALAAITTGQPVYRETVLPGAVLARTGASHLRVGTFELFGRRGKPGTLEALTGYALERHYPDCRNDEETDAASLLKAVAQAQGTLVAHWMLVGFVHGVMNTDNVTLSGETIDYGPCAFLDAYAPSTVFSSIDEGGRYAYQNQPTIAQWNLARFAEALLPLLHREPQEAMAIAEACLALQKQTFASQFRDGMLAKLGIVEPRDEDSELIVPILQTMQSTGVDYTGFFRSLSESLRAGVTESAPAVAAWQKRILATGEASADVARRMDAVNPLYIPRNHKVEEALTAALDGNFALFEALLALFRDPFREHGVDPSYSAPAPPSSAPYRTFCGT